MGIKAKIREWSSADFNSSIYKEIGPGARIALSKFAIRKFEETGRPLRIAIDTSIWLFQIQSGKGFKLLIHLQQYQNH